MANSQRQDSVKAQIEERDSLEKLLKQYPSEETSAFNTTIRIKDDLRSFLKSIKVGIGKPIYPTKFFDYSKNVDNKAIEEYNKYIYAEMKAVYDAIQK